LADQSERNTGKELISSRNPVVSESGVPFKEISVKNNTEPGQLFASSTHKAKPKILKIMHTEESRETAPSLLEDNSAVSINSRIETPVLISAIHGVPEPVSPQLALAEMKSYQNSGFIVGEQPDVRPLSDKLIEKLGLSDIKLTKFVRSGLDLAVKITNDKFSYTRDKSGKVMAYHLDTRLLGFSVPVGNRKEQLALQ
jgi:hypothetical protein